jgi:8-oxo-dGTP diphosphatase
MRAHDGGTLRHRVGTRVIVCDQARERVLLVEGKGQRYWTVPGGHLEEGETLLQCARREVREECGLEVAVDRLIYVQEFLGTLDPDERLVEVVFLAHPIGGELREGDAATGQARRPRWHTRQEIEGLPVVYPRPLQGPFWDTVAKGVFPDPYLPPGPC